MVRKSVVLQAKRLTFPIVVGVGLGLIFLGTGIMTPQTLNDKLQDIFLSCLLFSFIIDSKGLSEDKIITNSFDNRGIHYSELEKIVLTVRGEQIRMDFYRKSRRGLLIFNMSLDNLLEFLSVRLPKDLQLDIVIDDGAK